MNMSKQNLGKPWKEEEITQLLSEVGKKSIAEIHKRTTGGIRARLRELAIEDEMPLDQLD